MRTERERTVERHQHRVAVRRRLGDEVRGGRTPCRGPVLDDDRLPDPVLELVADDARQHVDRAAGGRGDDELDRLVRPGLRVRRTQSERDRERCRARQDLAK
jgi:hypothetical protein